MEHFRTGRMLGRLLRCAWKNRPEYQVIDAGSGHDRSRFLGTVHRSTDEKFGFRQRTKARRGIRIAPQMDAVGTCGQRYVESIVHHHLRAGALCRGHAPANQAQQLECFEVRLSDVHDIDTGGTRLADLADERVMADRCAFASDQPIGRRDETNDRRTIRPRRHASVGEGLPARAVDRPHARHRRMTVAAAPREKQLADAGHQVDHAKSRHAAAHVWAARPPVDGRHRLE
jgi:hypothetical protein